MFIFALKFHALSEEELRRNTSPPQRAGRFYSRRELGSWRSSMSLPRRGVRLWMGGGMPDTRSIPMAETREPPCQAHARPESARQARQSIHAKQRRRPNRRAKHVRTSTRRRAKQSSRAEQAHRGKQSSRSTQSPAGASSQAGSPIHALRPTLSASSASQRHLEHERKCASLRQSHQGSRRRKSR